MATEIHRASSESESNTALTSPQTKVTLNFTPDTTTDWLLLWSCEIAGSNTGRSDLADFQFAGTSEGEFESENIESNFYTKVFTGFKIVTSVAQNEQTATIRYWTENSANTIFIRRARILAIPLDGTYYYDEQDDPSPYTLAGTSYEDLASITQDPDDECLLLAYSEYSTQSTSNSVFVRTNHGGVDIGTTTSEAKDTTDWLPHFTVNYKNIVASTTFKLEGRNEASTDHDVRRNRVAVIPVTSNALIINHAETVGPEEEPGTTYVTEHTTQWGADGNIIDIIASCQTYGDATAGAGYHAWCRLTIAGTVYGEQERGFKDDSDYLTAAWIASATPASGTRDIDLDQKSAASTNPDAGMGHMNALTIFYGTPSANIDLYPNQADITITGHAPIVDEGGRATPGDFILRKNDLDGSSLITTTPQKVLFDTEVDSKGESIQYEGGTWSLKPGLYLFHQQEYYDCPDASDGQRVLVQHRLVIDGVEVIEGGANGYCRTYNTGSDQMYISGAGIIRVTSLAQVYLRAYRTDDSTGTTCTRSDDNGTISFLALNESNPHGLYEITGDETVSGAGYTDTPFDTTIAEEGMTRTGALVNVERTGRYIVTASIHLQMASAADEFEVFTRLGLDDVYPMGGYSQRYLPGLDSCQDAVLTFCGLVSITAGEDLSFEYYRSAGGAATEYIKDGSNIQIYRLPDTADSVRLYSSNNDMNDPSEYLWDSQDWIDSGSFSHTVVTAALNIDSADDYFFFVTMMAVLQADADAGPGGWWQVDGDGFNGCYDGAQGFQSGVDSAGQAGYGGARLMPALTASNWVTWRAWQGTNQGGIMSSYAALSGFAIGTATGVDLFPDTASISLTGHAPTIDISETTFVDIPVPKADITITGLAPSVGLTATVPVPKADVTITGLAPTKIDQPYLIAVPQADVTITGYAPSFELEATLTPDEASIALAGYAPSIGLEATLTPDQAAVTLTGYAPSVELEATLTPDEADIDLTGYVPTLDIPNTIAVPEADISLTGYIPVIDISVPGEEIIPVPKADITVTGLAPSFELEATLTPDQADISITGQAPYVGLEATIAPDQADITITGQTPTFSLAPTLTPDQADLTITGYTPGLDIPLSLTPDEASVFITGFTPTIDVPSLLLPDSAAIALIGYVPVIDVGTDPINIAVPKADVLIAGYAPSIGLEATLAPDSASITITGQVPSVGLEANIAPDQADITITGYAPTLPTDVFLSPDNAAVTIVGQVPEFKLGPAIFDIDQADISLTGQIPVCAITNQIWIEVPQADITLTGQLPVLTLGPAAFENPTAQIAIAGYAPTISIPTANVMLYPDKDDITITGYAPYLGLPAYIDASLTQVLSSQYESCRLYSDGTQWWLEHKGAP